VLVERYFYPGAADCEGESEIVAWEPLKKLSSREPMAVVDFTLETRGGKTVVRVVQSSFSQGADWENEWFDSTNYGWGFMVASLRWWLKVHSRESRMVAWRRIKTTISREEASQLLTGEEVLFTESPAQTLRDGSPY
jgi:hypothetical protein